VLIVDHDLTPRPGPGIADRLARLPVPIGALRRAVGVRCTVFVSHAVVDGAVPRHLAHIVACKSAARYAADLRWLARRFRFVTYGDVIAALDGGKSLPPTAALLTFDDGYAEIASVVAPLVSELGILPLCFLTESLLDNGSLSDDCRASLCVDWLLGLSPTERTAALSAVGIESPGAGDLSAGDPASAAILAARIRRA